MAGHHGCPLEAGQAPHQGAKTVTGFQKECLHISHCQENGLFPLRRGSSPTPHRGFCL